MRKIRVLVVEDSAVFRELLVNGLNSDSSIEVVATAVDPYEARDKIIEYQPDVMTLDIELPKMNGIDFLRKLIPQYPIPVVVISSLNDKVFDAMQAGAVDFVAKPVVSEKSALERFIKRELPVKIKIASTARISFIKKKNPAKRFVAENKRELLIAIGASTGGTEAIASVVKEFGVDIPGVVVVQHMPPGFTQMYAKRLNDQCRVTVKEAVNGDLVLPGQVLIAPGGNCQMRICKSGKNYKIDLRKGPKINGHCPSVDVLFESVASVAQSNAIGILLTGMGADGARGLLNMRQMGAKTIGQDESTCVVYGMPKVAYDIGAVQYQEKLTDIPKRTYNLLNQM
ncbi:MAG: chemotaxis response regulator protein-glutamate methylesterase [Agathobacter sp.]|nr:chemotaxis response regulator protein-glutamate methylesterase [Agathobacter sp.]